MYSWSVPLARYMRRPRSRSASSRRAGAGHQVLVRGTRPAAQFLERGPRCARAAGPGTCACRRAGRAACRRASSTSSASAIIWYMVCLPVSRQTKSSTTVRSSASLSPVLRSRRISTIMGTITSIQPERMREMVPSKSKRQTRALSPKRPGEAVRSFRRIGGSGIGFRFRRRARDGEFVFERRDFGKARDLVELAFLRAVRLWRAAAPGGPTLSGVSGR